MTSLQPMTVSRMLIERFNASDLDGALGLVAEDIEWVYVPTGDVFRGAEGCRQFLEAWVTAFPDRTIEITNELVAGDWVVSECISRATHTGPLVTPVGQTAPTGRKVEVPVCLVAHIKDGKIDRMKSYQDQATLQQQLGL